MRDDVIAVMRPSWTRQEGEIRNALVGRRQVAENNRHLNSAEERNEVAPSSHPRERRN